MQKISVLGSTGSIGRQALQIIEANKGRFKVFSLTANNQVKLLAEQARRWQPEKVVIADSSYYKELKLLLADLNINIAAGSESICELAADEQADIVLNALVGFAGFPPTLSALEAGKDLALANKESLVVGGHLVMGLAAERNCRVIPVDSEHSAIYQCMQGQQWKALEKIILTASGGPFLGYSPLQLRGVTPESALKHPNWQMGPKISIDSSTMMNKGLEVIEAHWLFGVPFDKIEVVIHRESIVHSMVEFIDGAVIAQLGVPDMRVPIQYALTFPERLPSDVGKIDWYSNKQLNFETPNTKAFPCLELAFMSGKIGGSMPAALNAANEEAVRFFLSKMISFSDIPCIIKDVMNKHKVINSPSFNDLVSVDQTARKLALESMVIKR